LTGLTGVPLATAVVRWQRQHGRHGLPWQNSKDPYRVWLSEVMLQQTQVVTVMDYYARFLARFPNVQTLAAAPQDDVLALWSGLGYYSRARNLHRCAQDVVALHGGAFPNNSAALATLPGIGRSTAAAIAAFCFGERAAILDGNVKRVLTRVLGFEGDLSVAAQERQLWDTAHSLLPTRDVDVYTQGLMDLGATVCATRAPACLQCPLASRCVAHAAGTPEKFPVKTKKTKRGRRENALLLLCHGEQVWLVQRPEKGVWAALWSLPEFADQATLQTASTHWPGQGKWLPPIQHALTHFDWALQPLYWQLPIHKESAAKLSGSLLKSVSGDLKGQWVTQKLALGMGLPAPVRRLLSACVSPSAK
jgi:A/G-specific adenine glycosylase